LTNKKVRNLHNISPWYKKGFLKEYHNYITDVPMEDIVKFGIEGGWYSSNSVAVGKLTTLSGYEINDPSKQQYSLNSATNITNLLSSSFFVGINSTTLEDYLVKVDNPELQDEDLRGDYQFYM